MIEIINLNKSFNERIILDNVNAKINDGDVISIIGPSGIGKTTLLYCINGLEKPTSGQIIFDGIDITDKKCNINRCRLKIGMVFQQFNLFSHLTVIENVMLPQIKLLKVTRQQAYDNALKYLTLVGMTERKFNYPDELSGGQKQRVAIARTLAMEPEVILFDEPTSALDPLMVNEVEFVIKKLAQSGKTMIIVTHEMRFAREISNRIFYMDEHKIYEEGETEQIFSNPQKEKTIQFINNLKCLEIKIDSKNPDYIAEIASIKDYCEKLFLDKLKTSKAQMLFEELCIQNLLPNGGDRPNIRVVFEFSEKTLELTMKVFHSGDRLLDNIEDDNISHKMIKALSNDIKVIEEIV